MKASIKTKKFVRKITAIASAALMTGLSMGVASADLSNLTNTFISNGEFNAYVVVGTGGGSNVLGFAKDVAGAVVVASAFAQKATTTTTTSGTAVVERNLTAGYLNNSYFVIGASNQAKSWQNSDNGFSWLPNTTVQNNSNDDVANVTATLTIPGSYVSLSTDGTYSISQGGIIYNLTFDTPVSNYTKNIPFPDGKKYQITNWTAGSNSSLTSDVNVTLGAYQEISASLNEVKQIGDTGATFEILDARSIPSAALKIRVRDADGKELFNDYVEKDHDVYSCDDFTLVLDDFSVSALDNSVTAKLKWTTSSYKIVSGEANNWGNWTIYVTANNNSTDPKTGITSIAWVYAPQNGAHTISAGTTVSLLNNSFKVKAGELTINSTDKKEASITMKDASSSTYEMSFMDENGTLHQVPLTLYSKKFGASPDNATSFAWIDNMQWRFECLGDGSNINITYLPEQKEITVSNSSPFELNSSIGIKGYDEIWANITVLGSMCSNADFNLTVLNFTTDAGNPLYKNMTYIMGDGWNNVSPSSVNGTVTITEPDGNSITVTYESGKISSVDAPNTAGTNLIPNEGNDQYTYWGTYMKRTSSSEIQIKYPEARRVGSFAVGRDDKLTYTLEAGKYNEELDLTLVSSSGESVTINPIDVGIAKLDTEITTTTLDKPVILIGGSAVNSLVEELVNEGKVSFSDLTDNRALVQLVDDAFNGQSALVIAGWTGDDTRLAAQVVASQVLGNDMGLTGDRVVLNTGVTSYNDVTVI